MRVMVATGQGGNKNVLESRECLGASKAIELCSSSYLK